MMFKDIDVIPVVVVVAFIAIIAVGVVLLAETDKQSRDKLANQSAKQVDLRERFYTTRIYGDLDDPNPWFVQDNKTGRQYLVFGNTGIVEVTPTKCEESK